MREYWLTDEEAAVVDAMRNAVTSVRTTARQIELPPETRYYRFIIEPSSDPERVQAQDAASRRRGSDYPPSPP